MHHQSNREHQRHRGRSHNGHGRGPAFSSESRHSDSNRASLGYTEDQHQSTQTNGYVHDTYYPQHAQAGQLHYTHQQWHAVPRAWENINPEAYQVTQDPALAYPRFVLSSDARDNLDHQGSTSQHSRQLQSTHHQANAAHAPRRMLTPSNLEQHNHGHVPTSNMERWASNDQREGTWNGVGYVPVGDGEYGRSNGY